MENLSRAAGESLTGDCILRVYPSRLSRGNPRDTRERLDPGKRILGAKLKGTNPRGNEG